MRFSRNASSSSSVATGISLSAEQAQDSPLASSGAPRKRIWGGGQSKSSSPASQAFGFSAATSSKSDLTLEASLDLLSLDNTPQSSYESDCQRFHACIQGLRSALTGVNHLETASKAYAKIRDVSRALCQSLLKHSFLTLSAEGRDRSPSRTSKTVSSLLSESSRISTETRPSLSPGYSANRQESHQSPYPYEQHLDLIRTWITCLENFSNALESFLLGVYKTWEPDGSPGMVKQLFQDKQYRNNTIVRIRNSSIQTNLDDFFRFGTRFADYDTVQADLFEMKRLLQDGESGLSPDRTIEDITISERGDVVLEFANDALQDSPAFRFKVSSHMLAETSPIFAEMFNNSSAIVLPNINLAHDLPPTPSKHICKDGSEAQLFRMPQLELNLHHSLEILLHAAHMHNDRVPREIDFDTFVAVAEVSMRYQCTAPLEMSVEYLWLPQWMHKATEDMPDGLLLISYAFGLRRLFTRMSKTAILNIVGPKDLESKIWPQKIKDKIWAIRTAKMDQVYHCCHSILHEYLRCPPETPPCPPTGDPLGLTPTVKPRCPRGDHSCDATCLGWLMMLFNELQVLPQIMYTTAVKQKPPPVRRSLHNLLSSLQFMASPPITHTGPCDFAPTFRASINDIYNSISGLTLHDVSGKHGWGLSKHKLTPQPILRIDVPLPDLAVAKRTNEEVALRIMKELSSLEDVYNAALVSKAFFNSFRENEVLLLRGLIRKSSKTTPKCWTLSDAVSKKEARAQMKMLRSRDLEQRASDEAPNVIEIEEGVKCIDISSEGRVPSPAPSSVTPESSNTNSSNEVLGNIPDSTEVKMTREEAERILWPEESGIQSLAATTETDLVNQQSLHSASSSVGRNATEKFLAGDSIFRGSEEKILIAGEDKNLSQEHYERIGLKRNATANTSEIVSEWV